MPDQPPQPKQHEIVSNIVKDPKQPPDALLLSGFIGASSEAGYTRLYLDAQLSDYVEIPNDAILYTQEISKDESPLGGSYIWIKKDAQVIHGPVGPNRIKANFLEGRIQQEYVKAAQGLAAMQLQPISIGACPSAPPAACPPPTAACTDVGPACHPSVFGPCTHFPQCPPPTVPHTIPLPCCHPSVFGPCTHFPQCPPPTAGPTIPLPCCNPSVFGPCTHFPQCPVTVGCTVPPHCFTHLLGCTVLPHCPVTLPAQCPPPTHLCPSVAVACPTHVGCPPTHFCPPVGASLACGVQPGPEGAQMAAALAPMPFTLPDAPGCASQFGPACGQTIPFAYCPQTHMCPSVAAVCPTHVGCPPTHLCPTPLCPTHVGCPPPTHFCPTPLCPTHVGCPPPTQVGCPPTHFCPTPLCPTHFCPPTRLCPSVAELCPSVVELCPTHTGPACPPTHLCPSVAVACPSHIVPCLTANCPVASAVCPSGACPSLACGGGPGGGPAAG